MTEIATRIHNQNYGLDPFVRSLLDTDFYKLLMCYFAWKHFPDTMVTFAMKNRSAASVKISDTVDEAVLRAQLDHVKSLSFTEGELIWLKGNSFYGQEGIFPGDFIDFLRSLRMPGYTMSIGSDGDFRIEATGKWPEIMLWEIHILAVVNEARSRGGMAGMSRYELNVLYANATSKIVGKLKRLNESRVPGIAEFGTRRRHGFLWQDFVIEAMQEELGSNFIGTSNALHAMRHGLPAIGTNAHELPMVMAALARIHFPDEPDKLFQSQYEVLRLWRETFSGRLLVGLPDTFGTTQFLKGLPGAVPDIADWAGFREDSKDPFDAGEEKIAFWQGLGVDPREKLQLFSDGLDVDLMIRLHRYFGGRVRDGYGWGTNATNDFRGCDPRGLDVLNPISVVCKVASVTEENGKVTKFSPAVKLSDNYVKATGPKEEVGIYRDVFGVEGMANIPVNV